MAKTKTKTAEKKKRPAVADIIEAMPQQKPANQMVPVSQVQNKKITVAARNRLFGEYTPEQIQTIKDTVAISLTDIEFQWFMMVAKELGLSPLRRQIHAVKRWNRSLNREVMTIQTGIDGFRVVADRTGNYAPSDRKPEIEYDEHRRLFAVTVWIKKFIPKDRSWHEYSATAIWDEFVPIEKVDGKEQVPFMWAKMSVNQLEKCAEAKALRRGFPGELSDVYVNEEMAKADYESQIPPDAGGKVVTHETLAAEKRERERGTLEPGKEENRGHGNEGYQDKGPKPGTRAVAPGVKKAEQKAEARQAKLETLDTKVEKVDPKLRRLTPVQINENKKAKAKKEKEPHEPQPYFIVTCSGDVPVYVWDKHFFRAVAYAQGRPVVWKCERRKTDTKEYLSLAEVVSIAGQPFVIDIESKDWVPEAAVKNHAPAVPDKGESAPAERQVEEDSESMFGA